MNILVAEDDPDIQEIIKHMMEDWWYILSGHRFALKPNFFLLNRFLQEL